MNAKKSSQMISHINAELQNQHLRDSLSIHHNGQYEEWQKVANTHTTQT